MQAPMTQEKHKADKFVKYFDQMLPAQFVADTAMLPDLNKLCAKPWFFGYTPTMVHCGFEQESLATLRVHTSGGAIKVLMVSGSELALKIDDLTRSSESGEAPKTKATLHERFEKLLLGLVQKDAKALKEAGVNAYYATLDASNKPVALVTPPGFFVVVGVLNKEPVSGVRKLFLPFGEKAKANFAATSESSNRDAIISLLEIGGPKVAAPPVAVPQPVTAAPTGEAPGGVPPLEQLVGPPVAKVDAGHPKEVEPKEVDAASEPKKVEEDAKVEEVAA